MVRTELVAQSFGYGLSGQPSSKPNLTDERMTRIKCIHQCHWISPNSESRIERLTRITRIEFICQCHWIIPNSESRI